ncbi:MAG: FAD-dependent oxidoreductase [Solirubrobacterales bacterium]
MDSSKTDPVRVVIVGGGVAALEAMLAIRDLGGRRATVVMYAPRKDFVLKPLGVSEAFGEGKATTFDLETVAGNAGADFHLRSVRSVDRQHRRIFLQDHSEVPYDYLVIATGTKALWVVPGAKTFWGLHGQEVISELMGSMDLAENGGRVLLTMPEPAVWPLPIYELALFLAAEFRRAETEAKVGIVTPERAPLTAFGPEAGKQVSDLLEQHSIEFIPDTAPIEFADGILKTSDEPLAAKAVVTLPRLVGRQLGGLPFDDTGFLPVDETGLIDGCGREYAAGDVIAHPVKFGGAATQQADLVAAAIAAEAWGTPAPSTKVLDLEATLLTPDGAFHLGRVEGAGEADDEWTPDQKIRGRFLTPVLTGEAERKVTRND